MQKPNPNPPIRAICTTSDGAQSDKPVFIVKTYYDSTTGSWYRKYSDGVIEQGGYSTEVYQDATWEVSFVIPFTTTNIDIHITPIFTDTPTKVNGGMGATNVSASSFYVHGDTYITSTSGFYWEARGL